MHRFKTFPRDGAQLAKLVKAIFRPWNYYCIQVKISGLEKMYANDSADTTCRSGFYMMGFVLPQVDSKSSEAFRALVEKLVACYRSVHPSTDIFLSNVNLSLVMRPITFALARVEMLTTLTMLKCCHICTGN